MKEPLWHVSLRRNKEGYYLQVGDSPAREYVHTCAFRCRTAHTAVRKYIRGNLAIALHCDEDGMNEPADIRPDSRKGKQDAKQEKKYVKRVVGMLKGDGPEGYRVVYL